MKRLIAATAAALALALSAPPSAHAASAFCNQAKNVKKLGSMLKDIDPNKDPKAAAKSLDVAVKEVKKLEGQATSKIKPDIAAMRTFMERFSKILKKFPTGSASTDPSKVLPLVSEVGKLEKDMAGIEKKSNNVTAFVKKECKITLG